MSALLGTTALASPLIGTTLGAGALLAGALYLLTKSSDVALSAASSLGKKFRISPLMLGVALGAMASVPELLVAVQSIVHGTREIGVGNIVGSNIAHVFLIMGATAAIAAIPKGKGLGWKFNTCVMAGTTLGFGALLAMNALTPAMGLGMMGLAGLYVWSNYRINKKDAAAMGVPVEALIHNHAHGHDHDEHAHGHEHGHDHDRKHEHDHPHHENPPPSREKPAGFQTLWALSGLGALIYAADMVVRSASSVASGLGVSDALIGALAVGFGTALPELAINVHAARKKDTDLAVGNILGCNIFNILAVGGALALSDMPVPASFSTAAPLGLFNLAALGASAGLLSLTLLGNKGAIRKWQGYAALGLYAAYIGGTVALDNKVSPGQAIKPTAQITRNEQIQTLPVHKI